MGKITKVYLSASQQPANMYVGGQFSEEEAMHIYIRDHLAPKLAAQGIEVRTSDPTKDMYFNVAEANLWMGSTGLYISHHTNASVTGRNDGTLVLGFGSVRSQILCKHLYNEVSVVTPASDEGIRINPSLYELRRTLSPSALMEIFYHDNLADVKWGLTHFDQIAEAENRAILKAIAELEAA